ncbi:MlaD family protein [Mycolicibacterium austroafricanum]|uniref:MlaD family protein n=1 Tax=Mycolicibacterium austroafricanum TaxID=39687 RepID=UPI00056B5285|nr:MCE family protein [Mycolicibacterium austroafricanum]QZY47012.1 MCE family protein [Mycolicibacterium austroafricanum]
MPNSFDLNGYSPSNRRLFIFGTCFVLIAALGSVLAVAKSKGDLDRMVRVTAELVNVGDGLPAKSDVKFRGVLVGQVADVTTAPVGQPNVVHIHLDPKYAEAIPSTVTARVVPSNVFAVSSVQLVDNGELGPPMRSDTVIAEDVSLPTVLFQTTLNKFRKVFAAIARDPSKDNVGLLATLAEGTHGRGTELRAAGRDLNEIVTRLNTVVGDGATASTVTALADAATALNASSPELFEALDSSIRPMTTLVEKQAALTDFLHSAHLTASTMGESFENQTDRLINITTQMTPVIGTLADNAELFNPIAGRVQKLAENVIKVTDPVTNQLTVRATVSFAPTRTYVRADCPRYGELAGPSCETAPEIPTAPQLYPALGSMGFPAPEGVSENRPNLAPPRDSVRHAGELPGSAGSPPKAPGPVPAGPPLPAEVQPQTSVIGGNVGPVGSPQERDQLGLIVGDAEATTATQLLLGPLARILHRS